MKKTLTLWFGRWPQQNLEIFLNISPNLVRIKLHTKNQPPSLLNSGDGYVEDIKIKIWKTNSTKFPFFPPRYFF